ncbi:MAG: hypothetical protein ACOX5X_00700 [Acholeplasmataceae bacterium]|jgi:hypothetical protein
MPEKSIKKSRELMKQIGKIFLYQGKPHILRHAAWYYFGMIKLTENWQTKDKIDTHMSQIKPYNSGHDNLIKRGYVCTCDINGDILYYCRDKHLITLNIINNTFISNLPLTYQMTRLIYNYQKEIKSGYINIKYLSYCDRVYI